MQTTLQGLIDAEEKAQLLFEEIENRKIIVQDTTEKEINTKIYELAFDMYGIKKYWHKRIVRAGKNTLLPYRENPPDLKIENDDILFLDFGPVFEEWEADFGRTYVVGKDERKLKLKNDSHLAWLEGKKYYDQNKEKITGAELYAFTKSLATNYGWEYGNEHAGHLIGNFPHEDIQGEEIENYIHPMNTKRMSDADKNGNERFWIYEIHLIDREKEIGAFFEQMLDNPKNESISI
jgi:Xaa-Pro aminopeptidase